MSSWLSRIVHVALTPPLVRQRGTLTTFQADTLRFRLDRPLEGGDAAVVVPLAQLTRLDVGRGRHSRGRKALGGAIIGLVVGAAIGFASGDTDCTDVSICFDPQLSALFGGALFSVVGSLIGVLLPPSEKWVRVPGVGSPGAERPRRR